MSRRTTPGTVRWTIAAAVLVLAGTACAGPRTPVSVGIKEIPTDILLGGKATPPIYSAPNPAVVIPGFGGFNGNLPSLPPALPREACPKADVFAGPKSEAFSTPAGPPVAAAYQFKNQGSYKLAGEASKIAPVAKRTIENITAAADETGYTFDIVDRVGMASTITSYNVILKSVGDNPNVPEQTFVNVSQAGIYITQTVRQDAGGSKKTYTWQPALKIMPLPARPGLTWDVASTASEGPTTITYRASIGKITYPDPASPPPVPSDPLNPQLPAPLGAEPKARVDACGDVLDAWNVQVGILNDAGVPTGKLVSPTEVLSFEETYAIATQFGAFPIMDSSHVAGTSNGKDIESTRVSTITSVPLAPSPS